MEEKDIIIVEVSNPSPGGICLRTNKKTSLGRGRLECDEFFVSWDKIGRLLFLNYTEALEVPDRDKIRLINPTAKDPLSPIVYRHTRQGTTISPAHDLIQYLAFPEGEEVEAEFANACAKLAEKNGLSTNDLTHMLPLLFRMFKSKSRWAE